MAKIKFNGEIEIADRSASYVECQIKGLTEQYQGKVSVRTATENDILRLKDKITDIVDNTYDVNDMGEIQMYADYRDELSINTLKEIIQSKTPEDTFYDTMWELYDDSYDWSSLYTTVLQHLTDIETEVWYDNENEIKEWLYDEYCFVPPYDHFLNQPVKVNIMLDTGNMNYDFTRDNVLNWYGIAGGYGNRDGSFDKESSVLWLAKQQGKATLLRRCCKESIRSYNNGEQQYRETTECQDKFVTSAMDELANAPSHMETMTFLVEMKLSELLKIKELMSAEWELNKSYQLEDRKGKSYIVLDKSTMCGLFDCWSGGGSILEIECEKDIKIPIKCIFDCVVDGTKIYGYDVNDVYGLIGSCWKDTLKEIHKEERK